MYIYSKDLFNNPMAYEPENFSQLVLEHPTIAHNHKYLCSLYMLKILTIGNLLKCLNFKIIT